ncbi:hypothetical protein C8R44DRAFT_746177 [Mycena epipterygia]|nr:hypothetical protein C8R44DRAFT_746177 [Mycena epipterygia]
MPAWRIAHRPEIDVAVMPMIRPPISDSRYQIIWLSFSESRNGEAALYNVYRQQLISLSEFFNGMLTLPIPNHPLLSLSKSSKEFLEEARKVGLDGTSSPLNGKGFWSMCPIHGAASTLPIHKWSAVSPDLPDLPDLWRTGIDLAINHLETYSELNAALCFRMGCDYHITSWVIQAFDEIMKVPITDVDENEEKLLGWEAYRALARAQAAVTDHRATLAVCSSPPTHISWCFNPEYCIEQWNKAWTSTTGILGSLIQEQLAGSEIHDTLDNIQGG